MAKRTKQDKWVLIDNGQVVWTEGATGQVRCGYAHEMPSEAFGRLTPGRYEQIYHHFQRHRDTIAENLQAHALSDKLMALKALYDNRRAA